MEAKAVEYSGDDFVLHHMNGQDIEIETFKAADELNRFENRFKANSNECLACGEVQGGVGESNICRVCGEKGTVTFSQPFLDAIIELLARVYKVKASNNTAKEFYGNVWARMEELKKKSDPEPDLATGMGLTEQAGQTGE